MDCTGRNDRLQEGTDMRNSLAAAVALFFLVAPAFGEGAETPQKVTAVEGITEYRLPNGLKVLLFPDASRPLVTVNITILVGSRHEGYGETGMAHLLEHMLFKGCPQFPNVPKALRDHGADFNGTTWLDRTNYFETMPASDENLDFGIQLEADRLVNSFVKREDLMSEMTVVRNEFEMGENNPEYILSQRITSAAFQWHNYGKSTIGNRSDIERVPIDSLQAFYKKFYQPDNAVLIVAGKFDEKKALDLIVKYLAPLKKPSRRLPTTYTEEPPQDGERNVTLRRVGAVGGVGAAYHIPAAAHPEFPALEILAQALDTRPAGRLYKAVVETKLASSVQASAAALHDPGLLEISATCEPKNVEPTRAALVETLENLGKDKITPEEVERGRTELLKHRERLMANSQHVAITLSDWVGKGDWRLFFLHRDRLEKVTPDDVNRVAEKYVVRSNRTVGVFVPTDKPMRAAVPETPALAKLLEGYAGRKAVSAGEAFDPTPANLDARLQKSAVENIKVGLLPKKTRGEMANVDIFLRFGNEDSLKGKKTAVEFMAEMLSRGTKKHSRQELKDKLDKLGAQWSFSGQIGLLSVSLKAKRANIPEALAILTEMLREPAFPEKEFEILRAEVRDELDKGRTEPENLAFTEIQRKLAPYPKDHPLYQPSIPEEVDLVKALKLDDVKAAYAQVSAQVGEVGAVGDFEPEPVLKQLRTMLAGWTSDTPYRRIPRPAHPEVAGGATEIKTPDKANAVYVAGMTFPVKDSDPDAVPLEVGNFLFGAAPLASRLSVRVRGEKGLSYEIGSAVQSSSRDKATEFMIFAITNPKNIDKVTILVREELTKYLAEGPSLTELNDAMKGYLEAKKLARANDAHVAMQVANYLNLGRTFAFDAEQEQKAAAIGPDDIKAAWRKHIDPKKLVIIRAGDFGK
jgi:zinc protease